MELRQLRYFEAVARALNFSKAAEELHIAQPPLSRQIQNLEEELGVELIDRSTRPLTLTNAGQFFYDQSVQILARVQEVKRVTHRIGSEKKRWMGIGFVASVFYSHIPKAIHTFTNDNPSIDISLSELTSAQQVEALKSGRIDVGFGRVAISDEAIRNIVLAEEPLIAAMSSGSHLIAQSDVSLKQLATEKLVVYPSSPRPSFADQILRQFKIRGLEIREVHETNSLQTALGLVAAGMGVTIVPHSISQMQRPGIAYLDIRDEGLTSPLIMSVRQNDNSAHLLRFLECISVSGAQNAQTPAASSADSL
ncbi:LysR family transcriptional regulator [Parathalassolituus penaei]|uniref:LysR family transcriptional regulator n=1 Tax=Parathalassolituus penaei TaxID=2997323 RepID=A0A9X3EGJ7_9GAMM|nr:LysR family transcriptional regulator [Parathalassolituus penaei]MCY0966340.1 LysR family transcriptional regulator [Parathalassolituus penaei]